MSDDLDSLSQLVTDLQEEVVRLREDLAGFLQRQEERWEARLVEWTQVPHPPQQSRGEVFPWLLAGVLAVLFVLSVFGWWK